MRNFIFTTVLLLCSHTWISVSVAEFHTVEVQPGQQVSLLCSNYSSSPTMIMWFRVIRRLKPHCVSSIFKPSEPASFCDGFQNGNFETTSNMSTVFLKIKRVDLSDSGLYFCGYYIINSPVIVHATYLDVQDMFDGGVKLLIVLVLTVFLVMVIIGLVVKIKRLQKAHTEEQTPQRTESQASDDLNYAEVTFRRNENRNLRPASEEN
ncbi:uncharacterized protein LOC113157822 [Anabas testudineus]|uniref:uncharacterized protein LOC113157822 n=1 Tax=Anabas testudineus TaxID=64144 RepID=UPI00143E0892|nr:uncharacterized protein LOC113157822 [Anabas testudineus]